ncbi:MAG: S41 family peptidase [Treponema sp.]|jgi:carboxyl-terminal processing protease|nr:S41 family peptidase [Treponema sp.]
MDRGAGPSGFFKGEKGIGSRRAAGMPFLCPAVLDIQPSIIYNKPMENQNIVPKGKLSVSFIWIVSTVILCAVFVVVSLPRVQAQSRQQTNTVSQYASLLSNVFNFIQQNYVEEVDTLQLFEGGMIGMFDSLGDPYSVYMNEAEMADLNSTTVGTYGGVGLYISKPTRTDGKPSYVEVSSPIEDTPGWRSGINPGDLIIEINGESTDLLSMDDVLARLKGVPGEVVRLLIRRGERLEFPVTIVKEIIEVPTAKYAMIGNIGYLNLLTFTPMTVDRARDAINEFISKGYTGLILDLRNNYGGLLNSAVAVTNLFVEGGVVVSTKSRISQDNVVYPARNRAMVSLDIPMVVLINRGSASASEIVAGALKDRGRAYLVGEKSFGKGSVQQVYDLNRVGFKLTTARYYTPSDVNIDKIGIPPDLEVLFPEFTLEEADRYSDLILSERIPAYVSANPGATVAQVDLFARELNREYNLELSLLRRLIRNEQNRTQIAPVYDLDYDIQLQAAMRVLQQGNFRALMQTTKTLRELQDEALKEEGLALAS